jgi:hypothetical protein
MLKSLMLVPSLLATLAGCQTLGPLPLNDPQFMQGLQLLQMSRPQPAPPPPMQLPQRTNCVTRYSGNAAYTTCN